MRKHLTRREFLKTSAAGSLSLGAMLSTARAQPSTPIQPNLLFILTDQWRAQALGYAGDPNARTPHLDALARESLNFSHAVSCCPVCSPYRAGLMTGRFPLTHGVFVNDVSLSADAVSIAQAYAGAGYDTAYIGKWHLDGRGRTAFTPPDRRQGFAFWRALECSHQYNQSPYYADDNVKRFWDGYDAFAQSREAARYIADRKSGKPFCLVLSLGPPHDPYETAPESYRAAIRPQDVRLRPNVPARSETPARKDLAGYYAHIAALDTAIGELLQTLRESGRDDNTIVVFTSDHGDMHFSHGKTRKQKPWDESILVPFLLRYPALLGRRPQTLDAPVNTPDIMPTLLALSGVAIPDTVEGRDLSAWIAGRETIEDHPALIMCPVPFGAAKEDHEYRGIRTRRHTFVRTRKGPWLLFDNAADPFQQANLCDKPEHAELQKTLNETLNEQLLKTRDDFLHGRDYLEKWGYDTRYAKLIRGICRPEYRAP